MTTSICAAFRWAPIAACVGDCPPLHRYIQGDIQPASLLLSANPLQRYLIPQHRKHENQSHPQSSIPTAPKLPNVHPNGSQPHRRSQSHGPRRRKSASAMTIRHPVTAGHLAGNRHSSVVEKPATQPETRTCRAGAGYLPCPFRLVAVSSYLFFSFLSPFLSFSLLSLSLVLHLQGNSFHLNGWIVDGTKEKGEEENG